MSKRTATVKVEDHGDAYEPVAGEFVNKNDGNTKLPPTEASDGKREFTSQPRQEMLTYPAGVHLTHDIRKGVYTLRFDPKMPDEEFKPFFEEKLKPLLAEKHQLKDGPEIRFHWQSKEKEWELRYRFHERDADRKDVLGDDGKPKWVNYHNSAQIIASRVADQVGQLLAEKLGLSKSAEIPF